MVNGKSYTLEEIDQLYLAFKSMRPLQDISLRFGRSPGGIAQFFFKHSKSDPKHWDLGVARHYLREAKNLWFDSSVGEKLSYCSCDLYGSALRKAWRFYDEIDFRLGYDLKLVRLRGNFDSLEIQLDELETDSDFFTSVLSRHFLRASSLCLHSSFKDRFKISQRKSKYLLACYRNGDSQFDSFMYGYCLALQRESKPSK